MDTIIHTQTLTRTFGAVRAVDQLSLDVPQGIVFGFLGPNGSGKTTTIRLLLGLLEPIEGHATVLGYDTRTQAGEIRQRTGALLEQTGLYERLSAEDNLEFYGRIAHMSAPNRQARIKELLGGLSLWDRRKEPIGSWSRGMKQKVAVARVLLHHPALIFLDEPTAGLDPVAAAALRDDLSRLVQSEGVTVFLTTHNLSEAERMCQRVAVIRAGKLLAEGRPADLRASGSGGLMHVEVYGRGFNEDIAAQLKARAEVVTIKQQSDHIELDLRQGADVAPLVSLMVGAGVLVEEVRKGKPSLEDAFLELMEDDETQ
jgi:ABC-2 type transport system ATP-binding protein